MINSVMNLRHSNDTLAIFEYIKAMLLRTSNIVLHTVKRESSGYSAAFDTAKKFCKVHLE